MFTLHNGDCLQILPSIPSGSIDAIITDLPYGTTACKWDTVIEFAPMWKEVKRVLKPNGSFITTASQPFTSALIMSNPSLFKCEWIFEKSKATGHANSKYYPMKAHENIIVFGKGTITYNPQKTEGAPYKQRRTNPKYDEKINPAFKTGTKVFDNTEGGRFPRTVIKMKNAYYTDGRQIHPTQKPVALYEYLIKTYTNEGETVLDIAMGSGTTIEAAERTGRNSIGIEKDEGIFQSAVLRLKSYTPSNNRMHLTAFGVESPASIPLQSNLFAEVPAAKLGGK